APLGIGRRLAVLARDGVVDTGSSTVSGDVGVGPGGAITGLVPGNVTGAFHLADGVVEVARKDLEDAQFDAFRRHCQFVADTRLRARGQRRGYPVHTRMRSQLAMGILLGCAGRESPLELRVRGVDIGAYVSVGVEVADVQVVADGVPVQVKQVASSLDLANPD